MKLIRTATASGISTGRAQYRQAMASTTRPNVAKVGAIRCQAKSAVRGVDTQVPHVVTDDLPRFKFPAEDKADAETGQGNDFGALPRIDAEVGHEIVPGAEILCVIAISTRLCFVGDIGVIIHDVFS